MQIEIDRSAIFAPECKLATDPKIKEAEMEEIAGFSCGNEIGLTPAAPLAQVMIICHEIGHYMGGKFSFKERMFLSGKPKNVLTFDEIKGSKISLTLTESEKNRLKKALSHGRRVKPNEDHLWVAEKLLRVFFRGRFNPKDLRIRAFTKSEMRRRMGKTPPLGAEKRGEEVMLRNTKKGRDAELPSHYTEFGCILILENTCEKYGIDFGYDEICFCKSGMADHQRAQNIIARAFAGKGWRIPSDVDLVKKR